MKKKQKPRLYSNRQKKTKKTSSVKVPSQRTINVEILQLDRIQAINNLSLAVLETARALNAPSVMIRDNTFLGGSPALQISYRRKNENSETNG